MIREDWSPEQITGHLKDIGEPGVSPEWIYQRIYADKSNGGDLHTRLRCQKQRRKRYGSIERRGQIKNRVSIEKRPAIVDLRSRVGDIIVGLMRTIGCKALKDFAIKFKHRLGSSTLAQ